MALIPLPNGHLPLSNNTEYKFRLIDHDAGGNVVAAPAGDTVAASASGPFAASVTVALTTMANGDPGVSVSPAVVESDAGNSGGGIGIVLTDSAGLTEDTATMNVLFDIIVPPPGPAATEGLDLSTVEMSSQPTPTAPGP